MHLSNGKLVSERIQELLDEVRQRGMVPCEILLGEEAYQLLKKECYQSLRQLNHRKSVSDEMYFLGLEVTRLGSESPEYVAIDCHI